MNESLISIVIPAYNSEKYIAEAIESAMSQVAIEFEIIVINDGSTDTTMNVVSNYKQHIRIINQDNSGPAAARNNGVSNAKGQYIAFLDSDDLWLPEKLMVQFRKINDGYPIVYSNRFNIGEIRDLPKIQSEIIEFPEGKIWNKLLNGNMITTSSVIIKKDIFEEFNGFREELPYCEDWDLWLRCAEKYDIGFNKEPLVKYRIHDGGVSKNFVKMHKKRKMVIKRTFNREYGGRLTKKEKNTILSNMWSTSGWEAAIAKKYGYALYYYTTAILFTPLKYSLWYNIARVLSGRAS